MTKAIVFDCFGVLITDAFGLVVQDLQARKPGRAAELVDLVRATNRGVIGRQEFTERSAQLLGMPAAELRRKIDNGEVKDRALFTYIKELHQTHKAAVLSNVSHEGFWRRFTHDEMAAYFDVVALSGEIGFAKPDAEAFEVVADKLDVRLDECVMVDDREEYCEGARLVGMRTILYRSLPELKTELADLLATP